MEDNNIGGSGSFDNRQVVDGEGDNTSDYLLLSNSTDEGQSLQQEFDLHAVTDAFFLSLLNQGGPVASGTQPWAQQQLGQPAGANGCLLEPWITQEQGNQAAAATHSLIPHQHSGQSPVIFTGDPHSQRNVVKISAPASRARKRQSDQKYRENLKKRKQGLVDENGRLKTELEASVAENGRLKTELEASEAENGRLKNKLEASEAENGRLEAENGRLKNKLEASEAENGRLKTKLEASEAENWRLEAENGRLKSKLETGFESKLRHEVDSLKGKFACLDQRTQTQYACSDQKMQTYYACLDQRMQTQSTELAQLQNKFKELIQQNWRTKKKSRMSSTEEFGAQIQGNDSVDSAQNIPSISAAKEAEATGKEEVDQAPLNRQSKIQEKLEADVESWTRRGRVGRFNPTDSLTEYQTET